jgi:hypothetical protein
MTWTAIGMHTACIDHATETDFPTNESTHVDSNDTFSIHSYALKHDSNTVSSNDEIMVDFRDGQPERAKLYIL